MHTVNTRLCSFDGKTMQYDPKPKEWIKQQVYDLLKTQAAAAQAPPARRR